MAEANTNSPAPAPDSGEAPVERAPAELKASPQESASEPIKENTKKDANGADGKPAGECSLRLFRAYFLPMPDGDRVYLCCTLCRVAWLTCYASYRKRARSR